MNLEQAARAAAKRHGIDPDVFVAQIRQESGFRTKVTSGAGAKGIAQFMPATAKEYGVNLNDGNPLDDLDGAARYDANLLKRSGGDVRGMLSGYNSGSTTAYKNPGFAKGQTTNYVKNILAMAGQGAGSGGSAKVAKRGGRTGGRGLATSPTPTNASVPDLSAQRRSLLLSYLDDRHNPDALLGLASGLQGLQAQQATLDASQAASAPSMDLSGAVGAGGGGAPRAKRRPGQIKELFWQGPGGIDVKNGQLEPQGFVSGHQDHVHVASGPKRIVRLGKLAEQMGLHVGENPHFGGVNPVHVNGSYHYSGRAIDVSGPTELERQYAHRIAKMFGIA
jgi:hypothetical protein